MRNRNARTQPADTRAAIYLRVSSDSQVEEGVSLAMQAEACDRYCRANGLLPVAALRDEGVSSSIPLLRRPAGQQLSNLIGSGDVCHVVAYEQTRLFRDDVEAGTVVRLWWELGVTVHLLELGGAQDLDNPMTEAMFGMRAVFGRAEVRVLRKRVKDAMSQIAATGRKPSGRVYGYRRDASKALIVHEEEAAVVRRMYRDVARGASIGSVVQRLNSEGVASPRAGSMWGNHSVHVILRNPTYIGRLPWLGTVVPGTHKAIVTARTWQRVQAILDGRRVGSHGHKPRHFASLFACGVCGLGCMMRHVHRPGGARDSFVVCRQVALMLRSERHPHRWIREERLMEVVWEDAARLLTGEDIARAVDAYRARTVAAQHGGADLRERLAEVELALSRLVALAARGTVAAEVIDAEAAPLTGERESIMARLAALVPPEGLREWERLRAVDGAQVVADVRGESVEVQLQFLMALYDRIELVDRVAVMHYRGGLLRPRRVVLAWLPDRET